MKKISRYLIFSFVSLAVVFISLIVFAKPAQARCGDDDQADFQSSGAIDCGDEVWHYDPVRSVRFGRPIFVDSKGDYLRIVDGDTAEIVDIDSNNVTDEVGLDDYQNYDRDASSNYCSMNRPTNCKVWDGDDFDDYRGPPDEGEIFNNSFTNPQQVADLRAEIVRIKELLADAEAIADAQDACEDSLNNPLSFVVCPIMNFLTSAIESVIEGLQGALVNPDLTESNELRNALNGTIAIANSFYIIIFLIIIIGNFIAIPKLDNYTIKKTLPKLIAVIILTQFSLLICQTILDLGNILAVTLPSTILGYFGLDTNPATAFANSVVEISTENIGDLFETLGQFLLLGFTLLVVIVVGIIAFFYLIMRYLFMVLLVLAAPIAFAAWVLPNTEKFFKQWWTYMIKLSLMFLMVSILFAGGAIFKKLLTDGNLFGSNGTENFLSSLIGIFIPLIVLLLVPKTLKFSGAIMAAGKEVAQKALQNSKDSYAGKKISKSAQEGKLAEAKGGAYEKFGQKLGGKRGARLEAKGAGLKSKAGEQIKSDVGSLGLDRQLDLAKNSRNADIKKAAQKAIDAKRRELANTRNIDASQLGQQMLLKHDGNRAAAESELRAHLQRAGVAGASTAQLGADGRVTGEGLDLRATFENPEFPDYKSRGGAGSSTPSTPNSPLTAPSPPPSGGSSSSSSGSSGPSPASPTPTPSPTPSPSSSSQSERWRAATPRPNPTGTSGPRVIPGTGGAVDLSDLGGSGTSTPPEPPPGTTE
ncbi:MAG TPA: hypothetical protein PKC05_04290 [Candidatus Saccharibacteria bacterium]|nr:hypothetical protein [Candidatus Saccharibacteria bacterium]